MRRVTSSHDHDVDDDCASCWTTISSEEDTAEGKEMDAVCCSNESQDYLSGLFPCRYWFLVILALLVAFAVASSIVFYSSKLHHNDLLMIASAEFAISGNDSAMPIVRLTSPEQLVPENLTNETLLVPYVPISSFDSIWLASNAVVVRALSKVHFTFGTLTSITSRVTNRIVAAVEDAKAAIGQLTNTWYEKSILDFDHNEHAANIPGSLDKNSFMMFDVALAFVVIMLGVQLQYKYG